MCGWLLTAIKITPAMTCGDRGDLDLNCTAVQTAYMKSGTHGSGQRALPYGRKCLMLCMLVFPNCVFCCFDLKCILSQPAFVLKRKGENCDRELSSEMPVKAMQVHT